MAKGENIIVLKEYLEHLEKKVEDLKILTEVSAIYLQLSIFGNL